MANSILFLTLRVFSAAGGIEKVCKVACLALTDAGVNPPLKQLNVFSMYDRQEDADAKYLSPLFFRGFSKSKLNFVWQSIKTGLASDLILLSHINLLSIGFLLKIIMPRKKLVLVAHGIEVWGPIPVLRKIMLRKCNCILAVSQYTKQRLLQECRLEESKITVLNNCLDPYLADCPDKAKDSQLLQRYALSENNIILLTLTRLSSKELYKGYDSVLLSMKELIGRYPALRYLIVGRYDEKEKARLDEIIRQHSLEQYVTLTGYIPDNELAKHYRLADVYVMPSKKEGFGIVFIEAMHYGLPVIAGNKDGSTDALCNGKLGVLVNPDDQQQITAAIEKVLLDPGQFKPDQNLLLTTFGYENYKQKLTEIINGL